MATLNRLVPSLALSAALLAAACGDDKGETTGTTGGPTTDGTATTGTTATTAEPTTSGTATTTTGTTSPTTTAPPTTGTTGTTGDDPFVFDETPPDQLVQVDRMGMPAVASALIAADLKDMYNESLPADDAMATYVATITASIEALHTALDDDLMGAGLTPCMPQNCVAQGAPLIVPDTLKIDTSMPAGFPNGRRLADPVMDITLAVILLDLGAEPVDALATLPLNPPANDKEFLAEFPYVADPH